MNKIIFHLHNLSTAPWRVEVEREEAEVIRKCCQKIGQQWMTPYPWKRDVKFLPDNRSLALKWLEGTECRLKSNLDQAKAYDEQMTEVVELTGTRNPCLRSVTTGSNCSKR